MNKLVKLWPLLLLILLFGSCQRDQHPSIKSTVPYINTSTYTWADSLLNELNIDEKIGQLLIWEYSEDSPELLRLELSTLHLSGIVMQQRPLLQHFELVTLLSQESSLPPIIASTASTLFNNQLSGVENLIPESLINATANDTLFDHLNNLAAKQALALQVNLNISQPVNAQQLTGDQLQSKRIKVLSENRIASMAYGFTDFHPQLADSSLRLKTLLKPAQLLTEKGIGGFVLDPQLPSRIPANFAYTRYPDYFEEQLNFDGLLLRKAANAEMAIRHLQSGADLLWLTNDFPRAIHRRIREALNNDELSLADLDQKVHKVLMLKKWMHNGFDSPQQRYQKRIYQPIQAALPASPDQGIRLPIASNKIYEHFFDSNWSLFNYDIAHRGLTLLSNPDQLVPIADFNQQAIRLVHYGVDTYTDFRRKLTQYTDFNRRSGTIDAQEAWSRIIDGRSNYLNILLLGPDQNLPIEDEAFFQGLAAAKKRNNLIVVNFGLPQQVAALDSSYTVLQAYTQSPETEAIAAQIIAGGLPGQGKSPVDINPYWQAGSQKKSPKIRISYTPSELVGVRPEKLVSMYAIANGAVRRKATPGGQLVVIKDGNVIFNEAFGYHTYCKKQRVQKNDLYDVASLTKIAATTMVAMKTYEQGAFRINDRIREHLPEYRKAPFRNVRIKDLMTHRSGIQPHMPVIPYLKYQEAGNTACDSFFCKEPSEQYSIQIAKDFYFQQRLQDKIWEDLNEVSMRRFDRYRYSDANMILVQRILERLQQDSLDHLARRYFYEPMGLSHITYKPLEHFSEEQTVPTENDQRWRRQQLRGHVHDETAALLGGVAGHAGLFSNAEDLAILLQMLLDGGKYAQRQYLSPETIALFTDDSHGNHRGLGFDKRYRSNRTGRAYDMTPAAYGHTGFTGTCAWVDPDHDLVFVFLSNRVFPSVHNRKLFTEGIRTRLHQVVYDALDSYEGGWPELEI